MKKVYVMLADGFEEIEAVTPIDLFRRAGFECKSVSIMETLAVKGSNGITVMADLPYTKGMLQDADACLLPGGMDGTIALQNHLELTQELLQLNEKHKFICAICAAPMILGKLGLVANKDATIYPGMQNELTDARYKDELVCVADNIITSRSAGTAIPFALAVIEALADENTKMQIQNAIVFPAK